MLDAWAADLEHAREHGGESVAQFAGRVVDWADSVFKAENEDPVHVVTHAGVMRVLTGHLLGVKRANVIQWPLDFGAIVWLKRVRGEWLLVRWNA
jgi:alpha-ribazole phosphatase